MRKQFSVIQADTELRTILQKSAPESVELLPVVENDGTLLGMVERHPATAALVDGRRKPRTEVIRCKRVGVESTGVIGPGRSRRSEAV